MNEDTKVRAKIKTDLDSLTTFDEPDTKEEPSDKSKVLEILLNNENINLKTEVSDKEILELARLEILAKRLNSNILQDFLKVFKELRVSKNRQGRKEIIGASQDDDTKKQEGFFSQFVTDLAGNKKV